MTATYFRPELLREESETEPGIFLLGPVMYAFRTLPLEPGCGVRRACRVLKHHSEEAYTVSLGGNGMVDCDCADFVFRQQPAREGGDLNAVCKHARAMLDLGLLEG